MQKTRKRFAVTSENPTGFKEEFIKILTQTMDPKQLFRLADQRDGELDFRRYNDYFWDVLLAGGIGACIGKIDQSIEPIIQSYFGIEHKNPPDKEEKQNELVNLIKEFLQFDQFLYFEFYILVFFYFLFFLFSRKPYLEPSLSRAVVMLLNSYSLMNFCYKEATTTAVARLLSEHLLRPDALKDLLRNDAAVASGAALTEITSIIKKMISECGLNTHQIVKILNEAAIIERFFFFLR